MAKESNKHNYKMKLYEGYYEDRFFSLMQYRNSEVIKVLDEDVGDLTHDEIERVISMIKKNDTDSLSLKVTYYK